MNVGGILKEKGRQVETAGPETSLQDIASVLGDKKIGALIILKNDGKIAGILSERDIVRAVAREGAAALKKPASDVMTKKVITCSDADSDNDLMESITAGRFRHLPLVNNGNLSGIISIGDEMYRFISSASNSASAIRHLTTSPIEIMPARLPLFTTGR